MYTYTKKKNHRKVLLIGSMTLILIAAVLGLSYLMTQRPSADVPVSAEETTVPVIALPKEAEKAKRPYKVEANIVLDYYDGQEKDIRDMTKFEGTYRANQGIDYALDDQEFDVLAIFSGEVVDVKEDPLFGQSCTIKSDQLTITYQSLKDMKKSVGDQVSQGDAISLASTNIYNKDLGNHLHIVVEKDGVRIDPEDIYGKSLQELQ
ncbi:MAG: M23 family metallopeptidase [Erysipelotrichaceae bacterium]|nr:M23 family metallopeptidase [Erysipelotrichaceae bacterium]MCI9523619.1 M23 family metallopeptidase [Erysipelotrichaceae bacterium]